VDYRTRIGKQLRRRRRYRRSLNGAVCVSVDRIHVNQ
jgi:hypothetical protein